MSEHVIVDLSDATPQERGPRKHRISVVVPTYNEAANLPHVFKLMPSEVHDEKASWAGWAEVLGAQARSAARLG